MRIPILFAAVVIAIANKPMIATELDGSADLIVAENKEPGATDWQLTRVRVDGGKYRSPWIEGYCSRQSVRAGETIDIKVSANPARAFNLEIFRTGYYGGAGARLMRIRRALIA